MTAKKLRLLILALGACGNGLVNAGSGDITGREAEGSVELSNLGEPDAAVLVAVPAKSAAVAPAAPVSAVTAPPPMLPRAARQKGKSAEDSEDASANPASREGTDVARTQADETTAADGGQSAPRPDWAVQQPYASSAGGGATGATPGLGSGSLAGATSVTSGTSGTTGDAGSSAQGNGTQGSGTTGTAGSTGTAGTAGTGQASSVLDSPELLAQRLAQYRQLMLNEPLGQNGLAANPAVQRRYLMINRTGYMGNFQ
jgi:hypothetical protein